jgi:hypothetical protein
LQFESYSSPGRNVVIGQYFYVVLKGSVSVSLASTRNSIGAGIRFVLTEEESSTELGVHEIVEQGGVFGALAGASFSRSACFIHRLRCTLAFGFLCRNTQ